MAEQFHCWVLMAGVDMQGGSPTPNPVVYLQLTDVNGSFSGEWWYAVEAAKNQMLAIGLAALANQYQVDATLDPAAQGPPYPACYAMYLTAP
jgi:hypothetical protein